MPIRSLLKKKDRQSDDATGQGNFQSPPQPEFTIIRSDTYTQEVIVPPGSELEAPLGPETPEGKRKRLSSLLKPRSRSTSASSITAISAPSSTPEKPRRLSHMLGLKQENSSSDKVPLDLPDIRAGDDGEERWEERATRLARENDRSRSRSVDRRRPQTPDRPGSRSGELPDVGTLQIEEPAERPLSIRESDDNIQEAIRLHESGDLIQATKMFGRLADPKGQNNALSQVLYGLALRHGWGCTADPEAGLQYLSAAASNAALVEDAALQQGRKQGGAAKGELVLAIFELANSFRHGWGVKKDPIAAKQYYETAANLGDTDAMNEVGWCYLEGFGCKKDKMASAKYYRLAEKGGNKILGNTCPSCSYRASVVHAMPIENRENGG